MRSKVPLTGAKTTESTSRGRGIGTSVIRSGVADDNRDELRQVEREEANRHNCSSPRIFSEKSSPEKSSSASSSAIEYSWLKLERIRFVASQSEVSVDPHSAVLRHCAFVENPDARWHFDLTLRYRAPPQSSERELGQSEATPGAWWPDRDFALSPAIYRNYRASRLFLKSIVVGETRDELCRNDTVR